MSRINTNKIMKKYLLLGFGVLMTGIALPFLSSADNVALPLDQPIFQGDSRLFGGGGSNMNNFYEIAANQPFSITTPIMGSPSECEGIPPVPLYGIQGQLGMDSCGELTGPKIQRRFYRNNQNYLTQPSYLEKRMVYQGTDYYNFAIYQNMAPYETTSTEVVTDMLCSCEILPSGNTASHCETLNEIIF